MEPADAKTPDPAAPVHPMRRGDVPRDPPVDDVRARAQACANAIREALAAHRCALVPRLIAEPVGTDGGRVMVSAAYDIVPQP